MELSETELRVLRSLHLSGKTGNLGSLNKAQRLALLTGLIDKGLLTDRGTLTPKGIEVSSPKFD